MVDIVLTQELLIAGASGIALGLVIGIFLSRVFSRPAQQRRTLTAALQQNKQKTDHFQHDVKEHFTKTAELIKPLFDSYTELHQHLVNSATNLAGAETGKKLAGAGAPELPAVQDRETSDAPQPAAPPKDYAPNSGVLREDYGFAERSAERNAPALKSVSSDAGKEPASGDALKAG